MNFQIIFELFRIKSVEPIRHILWAVLHTTLAQAGKNWFLQKTRDVLVHLKNDSATAAMSSAELASMMQSTEFEAAI